MKQSIKLFFFLTLFFNTHNSYSQDSHNLINQHINTLSSDSMQGRLTGSIGEEMAANYIKTQFEKFNLSTITGNSFIHPFTFTYTNNPHKTTKSNDSITGLNVIAYLNNNAKNTFIIGAHYDHLGLNEYNLSTLQNSTGKIHNGADDNASGVAAVLELARIYSTNNTIENVNFIFACFSGEELGLAGSKSFAKTIKNTFPNTTLMMNFDMIGRMDNHNKLFIDGIGTSPKFKTIITDEKPKNFTLNLNQSGIGPSDHTSFYNQNIPVLFFYTGLHEDYHKPTDDAHKINYKKVDAIIKYATTITNSLSKESNLPFTKTKYNPPKTNPKFKITLGIFPDYTDYGNGLHIQHVIEGKIAHKNNLLKGDIITKLGTVDITNIYSYMKALSKLKKGKTYKLTYLRNKKTYSINLKI